MKLTKIKRKELRPGDMFCVPYKHPVSEVYMVLREDMIDSLSNAEVLRIDPDDPKKAQAETNGVEQTVTTNLEHPPAARWQAEQLPYPRDADYEGAMSGLFDLHNDAEGIIGTLNAGDTFMYLFRRFGYPRFGWDGYKELVQYHITTPMAGVVLTVRPNVTGSYTFGYMLRDDVNQLCEKEERKPYEDWTEQFEAWALKEHDIEIIRMFEQDNDKLNRMWQKWGADKEDRDFASEKDAHNAFFTDQHAIRAKYAEMYKEIAAFPEIPPPKDRPADSIMKQCHTALCAAIHDMLRPVGVRDVLIDICGEVDWEEPDEHIMSAVSWAATAGCGVGNKLEQKNTEA